MKKLLNKFTAIFLTLIVLMSCLTAVTVSAAETTTSETSSSGLIYDFDAMPLNYKSILYDDDGIKYNNYVIIKSQSVYRFCFFNSDDIDYLELTGRYLNFRKSDSTAVTAPSAIFYYNFDGSFSSFRNTSNSSVYADYFGTNYVYNYSSSSDFLQNWVDNVVYSSINIKYNDMTVYYAKNNNAVTIKDLVNLPAGTGGGEIVGPQPIPSQPGDYDFIGPLPLIPIEGDPTFQGFKDWLIKNKKYEDLAQFGISCTENNISSVVDLWTGNYNSITSFFSSLKSAWSTINAVSQAKNIYNWLEQQWELYKKSLITYETVPIKDGVLNYETDYDEDGNFISSETSYLKLILGILNTFRNDVNNFSDTLSSYISSISVNINRLCNAASALPQTIANLTYNNFVEPINQILKAIDNININNSSDNITNNNIDVNIDIDNIDNTTNNFNIAFGDLQLALESKFSFYTQLTEITNTVQNYTYTDTAPELTLSLGSEIGLPDTDYKIDFSFYEPYREMIRKIIIAVAYISFAIGLLNKLPNIIGGI